MSVPDVYRGLRADADRRRVDRLRLRRRRRAESQDHAVLRDGRAPRDVPRGLEGGDAPRARRLVRRRSLGALSRRGRPVGVPRPRRVEPEKLRRTDRPVVATKPRSTASCRSTTAGWNSSVRGLATTRPIRRVATTPTIRPSTRSRPRRRPASGDAVGTSTPCVDRNRDGGGVIMAMGTENAGVSSLRPGQPTGLRLQHLHGASRTGVDRRGARGASRARRSIPTRSKRRRRHADDRRSTTWARCTCPFLMRMFSTIAMSIGRDHGSPVSRRYVDDFAFEGRIERVDIQLVSADRPKRRRRRPARAWRGSRRR